ncbi:MAG: hypothetical protein HYY04_15160, partial [Chloroflexi bacterium]|nr:hypothetical protein [Chloroflexota bacterium]
MAALPVSLAIAVVALPLALASIVALGGRVAVKARNILLVATLLAEVILAAIIGARATSEPFDLIYYHLRLPGGGVVALRLAGDWLTALLLVASALVQLAVGLFSIGYVRDARNANGYFGLLLVTGAAFNAATLANDLLTLLSAFVVLGFSFTLLIALDFSGPAASVAFRLLVTVGLTVGAGLAGLWTLVTTTGSTRLVDVTPSLIQAADSRWLLVSVAVGLAPAAWAGLVPLQSTITGTSRLALPTVGALLAGLAIAVGVTTLLRLFGPPADPAWGMWLASLGVVSIAIGGLGAVHLRDVLHQLGFIALMQSGLAIIPLGIGGQLGMALAAGQTLQLSLAIPLLYLAVGACRGLDGRVVFRQACVERPLAAVALLVAAFTAAGLPSTSGYTMRWLVAGVLGQPGQATRDPGLAPALWLIAILFSAMATGLFAGRLIWQPTTPNPRRLTPDPWHSTAQRGGAKAPVLPWA